MERRATIKSIETIRKMIELPRNDVRWLEEHYPSGSLSWVLSGLLEEFRRAHKQTPKDYMTLGALALKNLAEENK